MIRFATTLLIAGTILAQTPPDIRPPAPPGSISGVVVSASTGEPLRKASVSLTRSPGVPNLPTAITDVQGRFSLIGLPAGRYTISVDRFGYLSPSRAEIDREIITVYDGQQVTGISIKLTPNGSVTGRVLDDDGDPLAGAEVALFQVMWRQGRFELSSGATESADDRGAFRFGELTPGRYFVRARPAGARVVPTTIAVPGETPQPTWFGGSLDHANAAVIQLAPGENRMDLDIRLRSAVSFGIEGRVAGIENLEIDAGNPSTRPRLSLTRIDSEVREPMNSLNLKNDGTFAVDGLRPGTYELTAIQGKYDRGFTYSLLGRARIDLRAGDLSGVVLQLHPPVSISGRVILDGDMPEPKSISVFLDGLDGAFGTTAVTSKTGKFELKNVAAGRYMVRIWDSVEDRAYLKRVEIGGSAAAENVIEIGAGAAPSMDLVISERGANVWGQVKAETPAAAPGQVVVLLPEIADPALRELKARTAAADQNGTFWIRNLAPGRYKAYAWADIPEGAWKNPQFLERMTSHGLAFQLEEGQRQSLEVTVVPAAETANVLAELGMAP
jgi:5-hydroxyisourate hydrolase-like protein (transthyretin family)